jgi:hypothetical protein
MNLLTRLASCLFCIALITLFASCGKDDPAVEPEPTEQERITTLLTTAPWPLTSVVVEGENAAELFKDFSLTFTTTGYTTTGTTPVWARSGTWTFTDDTAKKFKRNDNVEVTIESVDEKNLKLSLVWDRQITEGGRTKALRGKHEFTLTR